MAAAEAAEADSRPQSAAEQEVEVGSRVDLLPSQTGTTQHCLAGRNDSARLGTRQKLDPYVLRQLPYAFCTSMLST